ncbi:DUF3105 domain-containing protein [Micromonospora fiedleri]|uniref:DUF3105 domain-containing protein n=1 Tax=Micromonospora fiedleri TaxID=1157498 RepID=A0ABS1UNS0_9ACTN|nr:MULTISPECIES: DUF3105 domain-containing protein [Micromonospora]MBL6277494.1 DUF3105 domain-containing protein [Micromonospora fiedleri]WSK42340.1 DUF3105 domain-containing protein [Micromonospora maris]
MSISTPGGPQRRPTVVSTGKKPAAGRPAADTKAASTKPATPKRAGGGGKGPRKPITPVKVSQGRSWGPIALFVAVGVLATSIIGYGAWAAIRGAQTWEEKAAQIEGIVNFRETDPEAISNSEHRSGKQEYAQSPPVGGPHNNTWQRCLGDVYDAPIAAEHALHSMEHGAVWLTYRPDLPAADVEKLADVVRGNDFMLMSPYEGLDKPVSVQAWGYQLKVDNADDPRIKEFATTLAQNATVEPGATCSAGNYTTGTGTEPRDLQPSMGG